MDEWIEYDILFLVESVVGNETKRKKYSLDFLSESEQEGTYVHDM